MGISKGNNPNKLKDLSIEEEAKARKEAFKKSLFGPVKREKGGGKMRKKIAQRSPMPV